MSGLELFQRMTIEQVARWLELTPFEIVRILVADGSLPSDLRLDSANVERIRVAGGLETWWEGPPAPSPHEHAHKALVRALLNQVAQRGYVRPNFVRADNLFRGLDSEHQKVLRRAVNALIKEAVLHPQMSATGLTLALDESRLGQVRQFVSDGTGPLERAWDQD